MPKVMKFTTAFCFIMTIFTTISYNRSNSEICIILAVTFGTTTYHLGMRLLVGLLFNIGMKNRANYTKKWYHIHSWDEIAQAMCQSELVYETNIVLSFVPLAASVRFGAFPVFLITSICSAAFDLLFVIMQRYNRFRILKMVLRER
ncbi:MAG: hypothetical protein K2P23_06915 [Lachnospiraceae bacterium]|nr:hypothetical protein [Lachnospiraceae bacterium]